MTQAFFLNALSKKTQKHGKDNNNVKHFVSQSTIFESMSLSWSMYSYFRCEARTPASIKDGEGLTIVNPF